jgi:hypothetical protein
MVYALQDGFDRGKLPDNIMGLIQQQTDDIWKRTASQL